MTDAAAIEWQWASPPMIASWARPSSGQGRPATSTRAGVNARHDSARAIGRLRARPTQEVELGTWHATLAHQLDLRDRRRVQGEDALDAHARRDLTNRERGVDPGTAAGDAHTLECLESLFVALAHAHHHADGVARVERRNVGLETLALDRP